MLAAAVAHDAERALWTRADPAGAWRVVVTPPMGKAARATVALYLPADANAPALLDARDVVQTAARARLEADAAVAGLPDAERPAVATALRALGAQLAERRTRAPHAGAAPLPGGAAPVALTDPDPWPDAVDAAAVLDAVAGFLAGRVALPPGAADVCALWAAYTHAYDVWPVAAYLLVLSPTRGCGKSTLLDVLKALARRGFSAGDTSPAALYRVIAMHHPTVFLDEVDEWLQAKQDAGFAGLLNAGTRAGGQAVRCVGEGAAQEVAGFDVFGPKLLAGIAPPLPDATRSRCLPIRLERATPVQLAALVPFSVYDAPSAAPLAAQLARWTADARAAGGLTERPPMPPGLAGRAGEPWAPLFAVADAAGGRWPAAVRGAVTALGETTADEVRDPGELLLGHVGEYLAQRDAGDAPADPAGAAGLVGSAALLAWLRADELRPWATLPRPDGLTAHSLAKHLRRWNVRATQRRVGPSTVRGFDRAALTAAVACYVTSPVPEPEQAGHAGHAPHPMVPATVPRVPAVPLVPVVPIREAGRDVDAPPAARILTALRDARGRALYPPQLAACTGLGDEMVAASLRVLARRGRVAEAPDGAVRLGSGAAAA